MISISELISSYGLPKELSVAYTRMGVVYPFDWQVDCLLNTNVMIGGSLVYCAPTGAGKTFVAEIAILRACFLNRKKAIFVLPYVSLVTEKERHLTALLAVYNRSVSASDRIKVASLHGGTIANNINSIILRSNIIVCTVEKASQILNMLVADGRENVLGAAVIDELHMIGDEFNGSSLEGLLIKLRFLSKRISMVSNSKEVEDCAKLTHSIQIVAMSATISNLSCLANWLDTQLYVTLFRPISLSRYLVVEGKIQSLDGQYLSTLKLAAVSEQTIWNDIKWKHEAILSLSIKALESQKQVLIFCPTRSSCSDISFFFAQHLPDCKDHAKVRREAWRASLSCLENGSLNASERFSNSVHNGIAIHHAGLSSEERSSVEAAYLDGTVRLLVCTTTLAAGINLPAAIVIIFSVQTGTTPISVAHYQQMCGRAGRPGFQLGEAEAYLFATRNERQRALDLITSPIPAVVSQLNPRNNSRGATELKRILMDAFSLGLLKCAQDSLPFVQLSLAYFQGSTEDRTHFLGETDVCIKYLLETSAIQVLGSVLEPTRFGRAIAKCGFLSDEVVIMYKELLKAQTHLHLSSPLHLLYLVSPFSISITTLFPDWALLYDAFTRPIDHVNRKSSVGQLSAVLRSFGLVESTLLDWKRNPPNSMLSECFTEVRRSTVAAQSSKPDVSKRKSANILPDQWRQLRVGIRAWEAWVLLTLISNSENKVSADLEISKPAIRELLKQTQISVRRTRSFCREIGWQTLELLITNLQPILECIQTGNDKLRSLLECSRITPQIASCLWEGEIKDCSMLTQASALHIAHVLQSNLKFVSVVSAECSDSSAVVSYGTTSDESRREQLLLFAHQLKLDAKKALESHEHTSAGALSVISSDLPNYKSQLFSGFIDINGTNGAKGRSGSTIKLDVCTLTEEQWAIFAEKCRNFATRRKVPPPPVVIRDLQDVVCCNVPEKHALSGYQILRNENSGFAMRHVRGQLHWEEFLKCVASAQCISVQISMRRCPVSLINCEEYESVAGLYSEVFLHKCPVQEDRDIFEDKEWFTPGKGQGWKYFSSYQAIAGVAICFGGPDAFYLPLPMPLPSLSSGEPSLGSGECSNLSKGMQVTPSMNSLPDECRELVCCYVGGFEFFLGAPSEALGRFNVCLSLNRAWASSARNALISLWRLHGSRPWECLKNLLLDPSITVVGENLQSQIRLLRSRGVTRIRGPLEDPGVAVRLLELNGSDLRIKLPTLRGECRLSLRLPRFACFTAIAALRSMAMLHHKLCPNFLSLFRDVEMPLVYVAARSEHSGLPLSTTYILNAQNDVLDRELLMQPETEELTAESSEPPEQFLLESKTLFHGMDAFLDIAPLVGNAENSMYKFVKRALALPVARVETSWDFFDVNGDFSYVPSLQFKNDILTGVCAPQGFSLLVAQYTDIEVRLLAHFSRDRILLDVCSSGNDVYLNLAAMWQNLPLAEVSATDCAAVKVFLFALMRGLGPNEVEAAGVPHKSCCTLFKGFQELHPEAANVLFTGSISMTILGRSTSTTFAKHERGIAAVIAGSASELIKMALPNVNLALEQFAERKKYQQSSENNVRMRNSSAELVFVKGGSLVYEVLDSDVMVIKDILRACFENCCKLHVPLKINIEIRSALAH